MTNPLAYDHSTDYLPDDCVFKISPSKFSYFIDKPFNWFRTEVLKEEGFTYNTGSVLGTVIHYIAEQVGSIKEIDKTAIHEYVHSHEDNDDFSAADVMANFEIMASILVNDYILPNMDNFLSVEERFSAEVKDGFYASGTLDVLQGTKKDCMIVDYKSFSSKTKPKTIPYYYKYQLLVYAYILTKLGYTVSRIRLVYISKNIDGGLSEKTGKPLKSYPPEVTELTEVITEDDISFIASLLELCVDTCLATDEYPELTHVIWHDPRLRVEA